MTIINCKPVHNFKFSSQGREAIKNIQYKLDNGKIISALLMAGTFHGIFTKAGSTWEIGFNVTSSDWEGFVKVTGDWPKALKAMIISEARMMAISTNGEEQVFWEELAKCLNQ